MISWVFVLFTFGDVYSQTSRLRDATDKWGKLSQSPVGLHCDATKFTDDQPDCVTQMCAGKFVLSAGAFSGQEQVMQQFAFCWGMWLLSEADEALYVGNFVAMAVSIISTFIFMLKFRAQSAEFFRLVEDKYDAETGWPDSLSADERLMIAPSESALASACSYKFAGAPYYIGVYVASVGSGYVLWIGAASLFYWMLAMCWNLASDATGSGASLAGGVVVVLLPLVTQVAVERLAFFQATSKKRGLDHPRIWAALDAVISMTALVTGPLLILPRLMFSAVSLAWHLLRLDLDVLLDERLEIVDYASSASAGLWCACPPPLFCASPPSI